MRDVEAIAEAPPFLRVALQPLLVASERTAQRAALRALRAAATSAVRAGWG